MSIESRKEYRLGRLSPVTAAAYANSRLEDLEVAKARCMQATEAFAGVTSDHRAREAALLVGDPVSRLEAVATFRAAQQAVEATTAHMRVVEADIVGAREAASAFYRGMGALVVAVS